MSSRRRKPQKGIREDSNEKINPTASSPASRRSSSSFIDIRVVIVLGIWLLLGVVYYYVSLGGGGGGGGDDITPTPSPSSAAGKLGMNLDDEDARLESRDESIFKVEGIPGKGKGVIAVRDIKRGELIIRERPLFVLPSQVTTSPTTLISQYLSRLTTRQLNTFFNLSYVDIHFPSHHHNNPEDDQSRNSPSKALAIFQTNSVAAGDGKAGIFPRMARLNHACSSAFNVVYSWREKEGVLVVFALKDIGKGQELLTTYTDTKKSRDDRRAYLRHQYSFHCTCNVCSLADDESKQSDKRLMTMSELHGRFVTWGSGAIDGEEAVGFVKRIWEVGDEEGYWSERGRLAADAAWVAAAHQDAASLQAWAKVAEEWFGYEVGVDSVQVEEMRAVQARPESHTAWGNRLAMRVPTP